VAASRPCSSPGYLHESSGLTAGEGVGKLPSHSGAPVPNLIYSFSVPDLSAPPIPERFRDACDSKWRLIPVTQDPLVPADLVGQRIEEISWNLGS